MELNKLLSWMKIPGGIVAAVVALGIIITALGGRVHMPGDEMARLEQHNAQQDNSIKANSDSIVHLQDYLDDEGEYFENLNQYLVDKEVEEARKDTSREQRTALMEQLVESVDNLQISVARTERGECLESMFEKLVLQDMIERCRELGIARTIGDDIDRKLAGENPQ